MARKAEGGGRKLNAKMLLPLLMIYLNYQLDYKNPETLKVVRAGFVVSCGLVHLLTYLTKRRIEAANDVKRTVRIPSETSDGKPELKTVKAYDSEAVETLQIQSTLAFMVAYGAHHFLHTNPPLMMQLLMQPLTVWDSPVFKVHVRGFGEDDGEEFARPWKVTSILEQASRMGAAWEEREKATQARLDKMQRGVQKKAPKKEAANAKKAK